MSSGNNTEKHLSRTRLPQFRRANCEGFLEALCASSTDAIIVFNNEGTIVSMNPSAENLFGFPNDQIIGSSISVLLPSLATETTPISNTVNGGSLITPMTQEITAINKRGQHFLVQVVVSQFEKNEHPMFMGLMRAMSTPKSVEQFENGTPLDRLSPRQLEILWLILEGQTSREIAFNLMISEKTVETHRANIMTRLGARNVVDLLRLAIKYGLLEV